MTIPHDHIIQAELLELLSKAPDGTMHCNDVYETLAREFPQLTQGELNDPYQASISKWANSVQWARAHLVKQNLILSPEAGNMGRGYWTISEKGRKALEPIDI